MLYVPARWSRTGRTKPIRLIVLHETISPEQGTGAEAVARYFATVDRKASAHRISDSNSTVQCVRDEDTAAAAAGANSDGLHMELVGPGNQGELDWKDPFSTATVKEAGKSIREWSQEYGIPLRWLTVAQVADGKTKGLCTHDDVSHAFPSVSTGHSDPQGFPKMWALSLWCEDVKHPDPPDSEDESMFIIKAANRKTRFVDPPLAVEVSRATEQGLVAKGVKVLTFTTGEWDQVVKQTGQALD